MPEDHSIEIFRPVPDFLGYRVSNRGRVQSCKPWRGGVRSRLRDRWRDLSPLRHDAGYMAVQLFRNGRGYRRYVHEIVLTAFAGPCPPGRLCRHLNGNPSDNRWPENICWGTQVENMADMSRHGRQVKGEDHHATRLTKVDVREIRALAASGKSIRDISNLFNISYSGTHDIIRRRCWGWLD
jgi:hypothetical protein